MKLSRFAQIVGAFFLSAALAGCGGTLPPKVGHYAGTNPDASFDMTSAGIENLNIGMPSNGGDVPETCMGSAGLLPVFVGKDGSFSRTEGQRVIRGVINGGNAKGHITDNKCVVTSSDGSQSVYYLSIPLDTDWTATYAGPLPTSTPILPPKPGHYVGSDPNVAVAFDVTSAGIENFNAAGNLGTSIGGCKLDVGGMGPMSISQDGHFSHKSYYEVTGDINGDAAHGTWTVYTCSDGTTSYSYAPGFSGSWKAHRVSP